YQDRKLPAPTQPHGVERETATASSRLADAVDRQVHDVELHTHLAVGRKPNGELGSHRQVPARPPIQHRGGGRARPWLSPVDDDSAGTINVNSCLKRCVW